MRAGGAAADARDDPGGQHRARVGLAGGACWSATRACLSRSDRTMRVVRADFGADGALIGTPLVAVALATVCTQECRLNLETVTCCARLLFHMMSFVAPELCAEI